MLIDGRNRREACKIAGVKPTTRVLNDEDPTAFVLSANAYRRNISMGQRAMAVAMLSPEPKKTKRKSKSGLLNVPKQRLSDAREVLN